MGRVATKIFRYLLTLGFVLLPLTSLRVLPTDYRPVSVLLFAVTGTVILVWRIKFRTLPKDEMVLLAFLAITTIQALVIVGFLYGKYPLAARHLAALAFGFLSYVSLKYFFADFGKERALKLMGHVYLLILALGVIEALCIAYVLPGSIKWTMNMALSGRSTDRLQLVTSEASWAAKVLLFGMPLMVYLWDVHRRRVYLIALVVAVALFCLTLSLEGLVVAGVAILLFGLFHIPQIIARPRWAGLAIAAVAVLVGLFFLSFRLFPQGRQYYLSRLRAVESLNPEQIRRLPHRDASVFIRVYYPLIGVQMFLDHPWGLGLGGYSLHFKEYLDQVGIDYRHFPEVMGDVRTETGDPRSLYAKILAENGLVSGWLIVVFFAIHLSYLKPKPENEIMKDRSLRIALLSVNLAILLQFGSYAYLPLWFALALNAREAETRTDCPPSSSAGT